MKPTPVRRILWVIAILVALCALMAGLAQAQTAAQAPAQAIQVIDDRGRTVTLPRPPQRIVSLLPSLTETLCALDQCRCAGLGRQGGEGLALGSVGIMRPDLIPPLESN